LTIGKNQTQIAEELGISKGTVAFHLRQLGIPPDRRFRRRYDWTEIQEAHDSGLSMRACANKFGFTSASWHQAVQRRDLTPRPWVIPLEDLLVIGRRTGRDHLKRRLLNEGLKANHCEECGITEWQGKPLSMQLHHVNGEGTDNRLENLRFLCANCHSQTDSYGGRNGHRKTRARTSEAA
jgi:HNH endonuclease